MLENRMQLKFAYLRKCFFFSHQYSSDWFLILCMIAYWILVSTTTSSQHSSTESGGLIRAPPQMWRCSRIMHMLRDLHPTLLSALEGIVDQMVWFRECWHEDVLRQLRQGLAKCYQVAFEHRGDG